MAYLEKKVNMYNPLHDNYEVMLKYNLLVGIENRGTVSHEE